MILLDPLKYNLMPPAIARRLLYGYFSPKPRRALLHAALGQRLPHWHWKPSALESETDARQKLTCQTILRDRLRLGSYRLETVAAQADTSE